MIISNLSLIDWIFFLYKITSRKPCKQVPCTFFSPLQYSNKNNKNNMTSLSLTHVRYSQNLNTHQKGKARSFIFLNVWEKDKDFKCTYNSYKVWVGQIHIHLDIFFFVVVSMNNELKERKFLKTNIFDLKRDRNNDFFLPVL